MLSIRRHGRHRSGSLLAVGVFAVLLQGAGCASSGDVAAQAPAPAAATASADARFLEAAERSSAWAVRMSNLVIANGARYEVKAAAKSIRARENVNLSMLAKERARLKMPAGVSDYRSDAHMAADVERLAAASGQEADDLYIQHMLEQRRDIISVAIAARPELASPSLVVFAGSTPPEREKDSADLRRVQFATSSVPEKSRAQLGIPAGAATGVQTGVQTSQPTPHSSRTAAVPR